MIISDPTEQVLARNCLGLVTDGYTSFKVFMTYGRIGARPTGKSSKS